MRKHLKISEVFDYDDRGLAVSQFLDDFYHELDDKLSHVVDEPALCEDPAFNAQLAATVEALCHAYGIEPPSWVEALERFCPYPVWAFGVTDANARAYFEHTSPAEFACRNLFYGDNVLSRC